jgi:hypothetical protein
MVGILHIDGIGSDVDQGGLMADGLLGLTVLVNFLAQLGIDPGQLGGAFGHLLF